jgi:hypothetical protein
LQNAACRHGLLTAAALPAPLLLLLLLLLQPA